MNDSPSFAIANRGPMMRISNQTIKFLRTLERNGKGMLRVFFSKKAAFLILEECKFFISPFFSLNRRSRDAYQLYWSIPFGIRNWSKHHGRVNIPLYLCWLLPLLGSHDDREWIRRRLRIDSIFILYGLLSFSLHRTAVNWIAFCAAPVDGAKEQQNRRSERRVGGTASLENHLVPQNA